MDQDLAPRRVMRAQRMLFPRDSSRVACSMYIINEQLHMLRTLGLKTRNTPRGLSRLAGEGRTVHTRLVTVTRKNYKSHKHPQQRGLVPIARDIRGLRLLSKIRPPEGSPS